MYKLIMDARLHLAVKDALDISNGAVNPTPIVQALDRIVRVWRDKTDSSRASIDNPCALVVLTQLTHLAGKEWEIPSSRYTTALRWLRWMEFQADGTLFYFPSLASWTEIRDVGAYQRNAAWGLAAEEERGRCEN